MSTLTTPPPAFTLDDARSIARRHYGFDGVAGPLASERDQNFKLTLEDGSAVVLKIANAAEDAAYLDMQVAMLRHVEAVDPGLPLPRLRKTRDGADLAYVMAMDGKRHAVRIVSFLPGIALAKSTRSPETLRSLGDVLGRLDKALLSFGHPAAHHTFDWDLRQTLSSRERLPFIKDDARRAIVAGVLDRFEARVAPRLKTLRASVIHNDANDWNVFVARADGGPVTGLIDLGDALHTSTINELAIALAYAMLEAPSPLEVADKVIRGYREHIDLADEIDLLPDLIAARLAISVTMSAKRADMMGDNPYLAISERPAWALLERLDRMSPVIAGAWLRRSIPPTVTPGAVWRPPGDLAPIVWPPPARQRKHVLDCSDPASDLVRAMSSPDKALREQTWAALKETHDFELGIGPWGERRRIYTTDGFVSRLADGDRRDMHLGLDVFLDAGTPVMTPLDATVVDARVCPEPQDYGGCVLLEHAGFRTLWGHLEPASIAHLTPGDKLAKGAAFARLGDFHENGGWIPHLHLQVVLTGESDVTGIIGVGEERFRDLWAELYPDPSILAGIPREVWSRDGRDVPALLTARRQRLSANLSVAYSKAPLKIVRGEDVWLYDDAGRAYLDCFNNVAHVGHCNPAVVAALGAQARTLNTNTRYLHDLIIDYADRLTGTLPEPLRVCTFVTSGSEANDLALRMAKAHTRRRDMIVVDWAYHGHTEALIELSPYKYKRAGGAGRPDHVHEVPLPDAYRAPADWPAGEIGARYAAPVAEVAARLAREGRPPAATIAETVWSCGGQVFAPDGYFRDAYAAARAAGAVVIADEVQIGFGRVGTGMWAFARHGVVPDILTLGKPIGNGHPMAAVITTPEIARSFANGMEYFATFGGNPVSCAAGLAVLDEIEARGLIANAKAEGDYLLGRFRRLQERWPQIGDVRGEGLFLGLDLVKDRTTKEHDGETAGAIAFRARELGVLIGTDGPHDNVLKVRPPMTLTREHAELLIDTLERAFADVCG
jgi:hypothetical protein